MALNLADVAFSSSLMLSHGFTLVRTLFLYIALILGSVLAFAPIILVVAPCVRALRLMLFIGTDFSRSNTSLLARINGVNMPVLYVYRLTRAPSDIFYWCSYHAMYAFTGDDPHRAKQIGVREALSTLTVISRCRLPVWSRH